MCKIKCIFICIFLPDHDPTPSGGGGAKASRAKPGEVWGHASKRRLGRQFWCVGLEKNARNPHKSQRFGNSSKKCPKHLKGDGSEPRTSMPSSRICSKSWRKWAKANDFTKPTSRVSGLQLQPDFVSCVDPVDRLTSASKDQFEEKIPRLMLVFEIRPWWTRISKIILRL